MKDTKSIGLSLCLVVRNEEALIGRCLESTKELVDEIIVVHDGHCSDRTLDIAVSYGARIIEAERTGEAEPLRPLSYREARGEWILQLDADEYLSSELGEALPQLITAQDVDAYEFVWPLYDGRRYRTKSWPCKRCLFRRNAIGFLAIPHAIVEVQGRVVRSRLRLEHMPLYENYSWQTVKHKWLGWARVQSVYYHKDITDIDRFGLVSDTWSRLVSWRRRVPLLLLLPDALYAIVRTLAEGAWREFPYGWKAAFFQGVWKAAVDWQLFRDRCSHKYS